MNAIFMRFLKMINIPKNIHQLLKRKLDILEEMVEIEKELAWNPLKPSKIKILKVDMDKCTFNELQGFANEYGLSLSETAYFMIKWYIKNNGESKS